MKEATTLSIIVLFVLCCGTAHGATIYIDCNGGDYFTIQEGIDAAVDGDVVLVAPGTYVETINCFSKSITLQGEFGADATIIDGDHAGPAVIVGEGVFDGFTVRSGDANNGGGIYCEGVSPMIRNCTITENTADWCGGGIFCMDASPMIIKCTISGNTVSGEHGFGGGGIFCRNSFPTIVNCTISGNIADGAGFFPVPYDGGGLFFWDCSAIIVYCTISDNSADSEDGSGIYTRGSLTTIWNSILWENPPAVGQIYLAESSTLDVSYCDVQSGEFGVSVEGGSTLNWLAGNIDTDPLFVGSGDYHLTGDSPCVDAGTDVGIYADIDGDPRPSWSGFDMGSDEYVGDCWDADDDGYADEVCGGDDCDDQDPGINPGVIETRENYNCNDGIDNDCDDRIDEADVGCLPCFIGALL